MSQTFNVRGYHTPAVIDESKCVNCHFCEALCPEFAIYSIEATEATKGETARSRRKNK
jgi:2-oxoglutarate ferredoxin oxidoreductase subunit delta